jgi:hypothetical protein
MKFAKIMVYVMESLNYDSIKTAMHLYYESWYAWMNYKFGFANFNRFFAAACTVKK